MTSLSIIITVYNEPEELALTLESISAAEPKAEVIVVDDGSDPPAVAPGHTVIRHEERIGIAKSRDDGVQASSGETLAFLDAHHRLEPLVLTSCADVARTRRAIVWPCVRGLEDKHWTGHGAHMKWYQPHRKDKTQPRPPPQPGYFHGGWNGRRPRDELSRCTTMIVPGYVMRRDTYDRIRYIEGMRGWGSNEPALSVKAFFLDIDILHLCGRLCRHKFRNDDPVHFPTPWENTIRNSALIARVCFDPGTWLKWFRPQYGQWLSANALTAIETDPVIEAQRLDFASRKQRPDREFWSGVLREESPV